MTKLSRALRLLWKAIPVALCIGFAALVWPTSLGGTTSYVKVSGTSMTPKLQNGDLVVTRSVGNYHTGDVIAYRVPKGEVGSGLLVLHRIVGGSAAAGFITRGDHRRTDDLWRPKGSEVIGEKWIVIAGAGNAMGRLRSPLALAAFAALMAGGAMFAILRRTAPTRRADVAAQPLEEEHEIILVVDDESAFRRSVARMLTDSGYEVREAESGQAALDAIADGLRPSVVLTDVVMPDISGEELSLQLHDEGLHHTVLMSGRDITTSQSFLRKPFQEHELLDLVRRELDERTATRP